MFDDASKQAKSCEFCGASAIVDYDESGTFPPGAILPIRVASEPQGARPHPRLVRQALVGAERAQEEGDDRYRQGVICRTGRLMRLVDARWQANEAGYYYVTETYYDNGEQKTRQAQRVRWEYASAA